MPTIVDILTFISMINTTSERLKAANFNICPYFIFFMSRWNFMLSWVEHEKSLITLGACWICWVEGSSGECNQWSLYKELAVCILGKKKLSPTWVGGRKRRPREEGHLVDPRLNSWYFTTGWKFAILLSAIKEHSLFIFMQAMALLPKSK